MSKLVHQKIVASYGASTSFDAPPPSFHEPQPVVTVRVTKSPLTLPNEDLPAFQIHKKLLCFFSIYFTATMNNQAYIPGAPQGVVINAVDPELFAIYNNWLYNRTITTANGIALTIIQLIDLWFLGQRFLAARFQTDVYDLITNTIKATVVPDLADLERLWKTDEPILRDLTIDLLKLHSVTFLREVGNRIKCLEFYDRVLKMLAVRDEGGDNGV